MAVITDIAALSQNPTLNGPDGATDPPSTLDDQLRYDGSFIAKLRDGVGFTAGAIPAALGFTPIRQGTGTDQLPNTVQIGWSATNQLRAQVDSFDFGVNWPINVTGNAATATNATTAANANALGGANAAEYVKRWSNDAVRVGWNGSQVVIEINGNSFGGVIPMPTPWTMVQGKPSDLSQFTNGPGYQTAANVSAYAVARTDAVLNLGNDGASLMRSFISGFGLVGWAVSASDARLKTDITPSLEDSLSKIAQIDFKQFRFRQDVTETPVDDGRIHRHGVIAQDLEAIDPAWLQEGGTWKTPNQQTLLYAALHAIKQLKARLEVLEGQQ